MKETGVQVGKRDKQENDIDVSLEMCTRVASVKR